MFDQPAHRSLAVTPNDGADLVTPSNLVTPTEVKRCRGLYVGAAGNLVVTLWSDTASVTFVAVPAGTLLPLLAKRVHATGTTAASIVALW